MIHSEDQNLNPVRNGIYPIPEEVISSCLEPDETPEIPYQKTVPNKILATNNPQRPEIEG